MKLLSACFGGILLGMPIVLVDGAKKMFYDYRPAGDYQTSKQNCANAKENKTRYLQVEVFDYNQTPWIKAIWTQVSDECGVSLPDDKRLSWEMEYNGNIEGDVSANRLQMDMYMCAPWGDYELEIQVRSTNGDKKYMEKVAWEVEYGADEYHTWDTLNTPFFGHDGNFEKYAANGPLPDDHPYAPIPPMDLGSAGVTYKWPLPDSVGYYSLMYSGPFPPLDCPNLHEGMKYAGCYDADKLRWTYVDEGPNGDKTGTNNGKDPAEPYRMNDGIDDDGIMADGVMNLEKCRSKCTGHTYIGLQAGFKCLCGNKIMGQHMDNCGLEDDNYIPEYKFLCSGDSRVLCGTDTRVSVYSIDGSNTPSPTPSPTPNPTVYSTDGSKTPSPTPSPTPNPTVYSTVGSKTLSPTPSPTPNPTVYSTDGSSTPSPTRSPTPNPTPSPTAASPTAPPTAAVYEYIGCSVDNVPKNNRVLPVESPLSPDTMSAQRCYTYCAKQPEGYKYFGTEYGTECFCGKQLEENLDLKHDGCNMPCESATDDEVCGGRNAISLFDIVDATLEPTPAPVDAPGGDKYYVSLGCYADDVDSRIMGDVVKWRSKMTTERCFDYCKESNPQFTYFGTQHGKECFCGGMDSKLDMLLTPSADYCNYSCGGNAGEMCGGINTMTAYEVKPAPTDSPEPTPAPVDAPGGDKYYVSLGCYADDVDSRIMGDVVKWRSKMTTERCFDYCKESNPQFTYFGTQHGKECFCGGMDSKLDMLLTPSADYCNYSCGGNASEMCGGINAMTAYEVKTAIL